MRSLPDALDFGESVISTNTHFWTFRNSCSCLWITCLTVSFLPAASLYFSSSLAYVRISFSLQCSNLYFWLKWTFQMHLPGHTRQEPLVIAEHSLFSLSFAIQQAKWQVKWHLEQFVMNLPLPDMSICLLFGSGVADLQPNPPSVYVLLVLL